MRTRFEANSPLRALHDEVRRGLVAREFDRSSFATKLSSAVEKPAAWHGHNASSQRSGVIPMFSVCRCTISGPSTTDHMCCVHVRASVRLGSAYEPV